MSKKVLHILKSNRFSGAENVACQIINMFKEYKEYEMAYCSPNGPIKETLEEKKINYIPLKKLSYFELKKIIKEYKPDIIHAHDMTATVLCSLFASKNIKIVSHIHGTFETLSSKNIKSFIFYQAVKRCEKIIFVANETYKSFIYKDKLKDKCVLLRNIINPNEIHEKIKMDKNEYKNDIIFLGRLTEVKNPERFIHIIEGIKKEIDNIKVAIVGDGELKEKIENLIKENDLEENIKLYGFMKNPYKILANSKVLVMTSISEGTPMVALEAMSLGIPIVGTPVDGLKEIVINNENGYLSESNEELSEFIVKLLRKESSEQIYKNATQMFDKINDIKKYIFEIKNIYK